MNHDLAAPLRHVLVLDLETRPDPAAVAIAGRGDQIDRSALHRIRAFSALRAGEEQDGSWTVELTSAADEAELPLLAGMDALLTGLRAEQGLLATFNGLHHDAGVLRRRLQAHWAFDMDGIRRLGEVTHVDLLRTGTRGWRHVWPSLRDACAGLGIPMAHLATHRRDEEPARLAIRKSQTDVCATFLLLLHEVALARGSPAALATGWTALSERLGRRDLRAPHLEQFRLPALLGTDRRPAPG